MKTLLIMRHAKSSWDQAELSDFERPLNKRGQRDAPRMADWLQQRQWTPDRIVTSPARRAQQTAELLNAAFAEPVAIDTDQDLYHGLPEAYWRAARALGDPSQRLLMIGHNPGLEACVARMAGTAVRMPTAAIAVFQMELAQWADWSGLGQAAALLAVGRPKELSGHAD